MSQWYPIMLKVEGRKCVVIGGGSVAQRKTAGLLEANAIVEVISPRVTPKLLEWAETGRLRIREREAQESDIEGAILVFAATDRPEINKWVAEVAEKRAIPVNVADDGDEGDFLVPAVLRRGKLVLTASASGAGPALASRIVKELADQYGPEYKENIEALKAIRAIVKAEVSDLSDRRALLQAAVTDEALEEWRSTDWIQDKDRLIARLRQRLHDRRDT
ncbi:precorrin-2 dehydrogenase/sirohydrochlorin ferrochelatase family protein [Cohnella silvisoli]|uniref:precorrin-2 dehydrogenase n=1 Tax=Cohnella silvisoli TaxID=2873699 RepID=A0ABV1KTV9_9BACL|nr:bifunctional precorrin-2 dehydrogenase/sirohydrochlorin ferrochelatase [Cohnella silvisoli]MCD9022729.1 bifunctional precorrin-2 dehydrogenase/sirohydrochlorin ferrochelatase [Cohnella silvisoli]